MDPQTAETSTSARSRLAQWSALTALGISALALAVGAYQTRLMQSQARASVWPYLAIGFSYSDFGEHQGFELHLKNDGVGPAAVQSVTMSLDDRPMHHWDDVIEAVMAGHNGETAKASYSGLQGIVIPPSTNRETDVPAFRTLDKTLATAMFDARGHFRIDVCYCSVYDECWTAHWMMKRPEPTAVCHESKEEFDY